MRNILIADDNKQILDVLKEYALREGFQVYTAESGKDTHIKRLRAKLDRYSHPDWDIKIAGTIRELAAGNYRVKTKVSDSTELGQLAEETDQLAEKLEEIVCKNRAEDEKEEY